MIKQLLLTIAIIFSLQLRSQELVAVANTSPLLGSKAIKLYPNAVDGRYTLMIKERSKRKEIVLFDSKGNKIKQIEPNSSDCYTIKLKRKGTYYLDVLLDDTRYNIKLTKEN